MLPDDPRRRRSTRQPASQRYANTRKPVKRSSERRPASQRYSNTKKVVKRDYAAIGYIQVMKKEYKQVRQEKKALLGNLEISEKKRYGERRSRRTQATFFLLLWICLGVFIIDSSQPLPDGAWVIFGIGIVIILFWLFI